MYFIGLFVGCFLLLFFVLPFICFFVRVRSKTLERLLPRRDRFQQQQQRLCAQRACERQRRLEMYSCRNCPNDMNMFDRQGNIYTVSDDIATNNAVPPRFTDFFYLEPGSEEAARIRAQLEKDDKELPSYEEVLRMTAMAQTAQTATTVAALPAAIPPPMPTALGASNSSFATTAIDISLPPAPPYTEIDMNATVPVAATAAATTPQTYATPPTTTTTITTTATATATPQLVGIVPSTSRAAATLEVVTGPSMTAA